MKNKNLITLFEYGEDKENFSQKDKKEIEKLNSISTKLFSFTAQGIKAKQFVGVCQIGKKTLEVLPKIFSKEEGKDLENQRKGLLYMLSVTKKLKINETEISKLCEKNFDLLEVFIYLFSKNLLELLQKDFKKNYIKQEENLNFLKGKLNFVKNIKYNFFNKAKFFCEYDEFTENILMNQIFKSCVRKSIKFTKNNDNFNYLRKCDFIMSDVENVKFQNPKICENVKFTRLNFEYKNIFNLAKTLLFGNSPNTNVNNFETFSFMFDMNKLFEEFIFEILKENKEYFEIKNIQAKKPQKKIFDENVNNFSMEPDIYIEFENKEKMIIDTKNKKINCVKPKYKEKNKVGISQSDIYQIFCYSKSYKTNRNILLYPKYEEDFNCDLKNENEKFNLKIFTINLNLVEGKKLKEYKEEIKKRLKKIF